MKKTIVILFFALWFLSFNNTTERQKHEYKDETIKCSYETSNGRIDGSYVSFYNNGQKKAEGTFQNNYRIGNWTVWDSTGRIRMQREYENPFVFKRIIPAMPNEKPIVLLNVPYTLKYNKDGCIDYFNVKERMVLWEKRIWRFIPITDNEILFQHNLLYQLLQTDSIKVYSDERFTTEQKKTIIDTNAVEVIGYKIKEDCFFDIERLLDETRIFGLCPVTVNKISKDTSDLYWVYFPQIRNLLGQTKIQSQFSNIKTLDDLFFFRDFYGQIYKESNIFDRQISDYKSGLEIAKEAERIEINIIESEHDLWIDYTK